MTKEIYDIQTLSSYLKVSVSEVRKLVRENKVPYFRVGNRLRPELKKMNNWLEKLEEETAKKFIVAPYLNRDYYTIINTDWPVLDVLIWVESTKQPLHRQIMLDVKAKAMAMSGGERGKVFKR